LITKRLTNSTATRPAKVQLPPYPNQTPLIRWQPHYMNKQNQAIYGQAYFGLMDPDLDDFATLQYRNAQ